MWKSKEKLLCVRKKVNAGTVERCSDRDSSHRSPLMLPQSREESQRDASRKYREGWGKEDSRYLESSLGGGKYVSLIF